MKNETCGSCAHFYQHYILTEGRSMRVFCGHCAIPKIKHRKPFSKACENYVYGPPDEDAYADKKYLTKEMLKYLLNLELLPQVENATNDA